jgi:hypothetical protein
MYGNSCSQHPNDSLKLHPDRTRSSSERVIIWQYGMRRVEMMPHVVELGTWVPLTGLTERVSSDGAIPPEQNHFLLMVFHKPTLISHWCTFCAVYVPLFSINYSKVS